jgi:hypothetical protein
LYASLAGQVGRVALSFSGMHRIGSWDALNRRLGRPRTILCLGNGPSSESRALENIHFDCLLRVNWVWRRRGRHTAPQLVFTADTDCPPESSPIICFPTREDANRILAGYPRRTGAPPQEYLVFTEMPSATRDTAWSHRPTNGALMIAAAIQLRPSRLVIAGIDLYRHAAGKYPGLPEEQNEYDAIHHRDVDLTFIRAALKDHQGEVQILSEALEAELNGKETSTVSVKSGFCK